MFLFNIKYQQNHGALKGQKNVLTCNEYSLYVFLIALLEPKKKGNIIKFVHIVENLIHECLFKAINIKGIASRKFN